MHTNRLIDETSPYLLQHAHNPVDWYAWGPEAFEAARAAGKPIFLSIGYSTCYWCHVMERESFENDAVAAVMNEHFVSVKLDREERPDVDEIYMTATQIFNRGRGGWPMSVFLEPDSLKPFYAGTYFPAEQFTTLLGRIAEVWGTRRDAILADANRLAEVVTLQLSERAAPQPLDSAAVEQGLAQLMGMYDAADGGFGRGQNKFPVPPHPDFLIGAGWSNDAVRNAVTHTLDRMATGGLYDQVGGGFHRYSTDRKWLVPHFEKMLYDNGQLVSTYAAAYERTRDPFYARVIRQTLAYVQREMTDPAGGFWSAQDAEAEAREGADYVWTVDELRVALEDAGLAGDVDFTLQVYDLETVHDPHHPQSEWKSVLYLRDRPDVLAGRLGMDETALIERLDRVNAALLTVRETRPQPTTDDKVLAGWNGLMIAGFADARRVLGDKAYADAADRAADFVLTKMRRVDGGLLRTYRDGEAKIDAFLEDYAFMIRGLLALHRATGDTRRLDQAATLAAAAKTRFWDQVNGAYYDTLADQQDLFVRTHSTYDGAVPCGNSVMLDNLLELHDATEDPAYLQDAEAAFKGVSAAISGQPVRMTLGTLALDRWIGIHGERLAWGDQSAAPPQGEPPVRAAVSADRLVLGPDQPASFEVTLTIAEGYHINAHRPGPEFLIPLEVRVIGEGVAAEVTYPDGEPYRGPIAEGEMRVHTGTVTVGVRLEQTGAVPDPPQLVVTWQTCTDTACLPPTSQPMKLDLTIPATP